MRLALAAVAGALALTGCGGNDVAGSGAAEAVPGDAFAFAELDANLDSDQWRQVQELLNRFPERPQLLDQLNEALRAEGLDYERDVAPAVGDTIALAWLGKTAADAVVLTKADDRDKLRALLGKLSDDEVALGEIDGWTVAAEQQSAIDALRSGGGSLSDNDEFKAGVDRLPGERLAYGWARKGALPQDAPRLELEWFAAAVEARDDAAAATVVTQGGGTAENVGSKWIDRAPADALAFLSFNADGFRDQTKTLAPYAAMLGVPLDELLSEVKGEGALWVRPATGLPELTLVLEAADAERARTALAPLLARLPLQLKLGVVDGALVATTGASPAAALRTTGGSLAESADFGEAAESAGLPDETNGFLFVNVADTLPLLDLAVYGGLDLPAELLGRLRPIRSIVGWSEIDDGLAVQRLFLQIQ